MKLLKNKNIVQAGLIGVTLMLSVFFGYLSHADSNPMGVNIIDTKSKLDQAVVSTSHKTMTSHVLYYKDEIIARVKNPETLDVYLDTIYQERYAQNFPKSKISLNDDFYYVEELTFNQYENIDDKVIAYLDSNDYFSIQANKVTFSNGAVIYVKEVEDFESARQNFLLNFVDDTSLSALQSKPRVESLKYYGEQITDLSVQESIVIQKDYTSVENVMTSDTEILNFLSYGYDPDVQVYETVKFDTLQGIARQFGMNPSQVVSLNRNVVKDVNQVVAEGISLNVSKFDSPFTVLVTKERFVSEVIDQPERKYIEDNTLEEGHEVVEVIGRDGSMDSHYNDTYVNGESVDSVLVTSSVKSAPVQEVVRIGTYVEPSQGTGRFGWPLGNSYVLCGWGCYAGHRGVDFSTYGSGYGPIVASDTGIVVTNGYQAGGWGYYIKIDHGNGFATLYAHMNAPGYFNVGETVSRGTNIGYVGMTGFTTYPHVHFEIYDNGTRVNGCIYLGC